VQQPAETFFAHVQAATGAGLPEFVQDEFDAFLECGILAHGLPDCLRTASSRDPDMPSVHLASNRQRARRIGRWKHLGHVEDAAPPSGGRTTSK